MQQPSVSLSVHASFFTSIGGGLDGGWQLDAVVHPLSVSHPTCLAALNSLLHQEAEGIAGILRACTVPLQRRHISGGRGGGEFEYQHQSHSMSIGTLSQFETHTLPDTNVFSSTDFLWKVQNSRHSLTKQSSTNAIYVI